MIDPHTAFSFKVVPVEGTSPLVVLHDGSKEEARLMKELSFLLDCKVELKKESSDVIEKLLRKHYPGFHNKSGTSILNEDLSVQNERILETILEDAASLSSSDIHIEPGEHAGRLRFRIDGKLLERITIPQAVYPSLVNRIKVRSGLSISEKRIPQDGRFKISCRDRKYELRVSVMPSLYGEKVVMRILGTNQNAPELSKLGLLPEQLQLLSENILMPQGLILFSGPTGSGKTSSLYSCLSELNTMERNILTIEDPVEITLNGINQVQVKPEVGLTFAAALRAFLRQDPDVIMIGEIRDSETAALAIRASLTGHLVISTIHTNSALESITRLRDLGIPDFLVASTLTLSVAQRLIRKLCPDCRMKSVPAHPDAPLYIKGAGCENCNMTGYKGRVACFEMMPLDQEIRIAIVEGQGVDKMVLKSYSKIEDVCRDLVIRGITTSEEFVSATGKAYG